MARLKRLVGILDKGKGQRQCSEPFQARISELENDKQKLAEQVEALQVERDGLLAMVDTNTEEIMQLRVSFDDLIERLKEEKQRKEEEG